MPDFVSSARYLLGSNAGKERLMGTCLSTIGYEADTLPNVISRLRAAHVDVVIDVRAVAASRRAGFSKTILRNSLEADGIDYVHLRDLGTPKPGRDAARKGRIAEMEAIFAEHMATPEAQDALAQAVQIIQARHAALLCFEACASGCHRRVVADLVQQQTGCDIQNL